MTWVWRGLGLIVLLLILGAATLWVWKPWVPSLQITHPAPEGQAVREPALTANFYPGPRSAPHPGIVLLGGSEGGLARGGHRMAVELQKAGFAVLHVSYYRAPGQPAQLENVPLEPIERGLDWLMAQTGVDKSRIGILGGSKGAEAALIMATKRPEFRAVAAGMPSSVSWAGINWNYGGASSAPSWSHSGQPLPALPYGTYDWNVGVLSVYKNGLAAFDNYPDTHIAIEKTAAPVLLICGEQDTLWPSCDMARQVEARAKAKGNPAVTLIAYQDAGHAVLGVPVEKTNPNYQALGSIGGSADGNNAARQDSFPKIIAFFKRALSAPPQ